MFNFGTFRVGPDEHTLSQLCKAARRGLVQSAPTLALACLPRGYLDHLKALPRAEVVTRGEAWDFAEGRPRAPVRAGDLILPAREFLFEMEPLATDFASTRIVQVRHMGDGADAKLVVTVLSRIVDRKVWSITIPGTMETLDECESDPARIRIAPEIGVAVLRHEMACAAFGISAVDARQREMLGAVRH